MKNYVIIVFMAVLFVGVSPAGAIVHKQNDKDSFKEGTNRPSECLTKGCIEDFGRIDMFGQEGGGSPKEMPYEDSSVLDIHKDLLIKKFAGLGIDLDRPKDPQAMGRKRDFTRDGQEAGGNVWEEGQEAGGNVWDDRESQTVAGYCNGYRECGAKPGQEGGGENLGDLITEGPYKGYRLVPASIMGSKDSRKKVTKREVAIRVPRVFCKDPVTGIESWGGSGVIANLETGLLLTAAHNLVKSNLYKTKEEQLRTIVDRCKVEILDENQNVIFSSKIKLGGVEIGDHFLPENYDELSFQDKRNAQIRASEEDWAALRLEKPFPSDTRTFGLEAVDPAVNLTGTKIKNVAYHHVPDNPATQKNEEYVGLMASDGLIRNTNGGPEQNKSDKIFLHDLDTNGMASGSAIYGYNQETKEWVVMGMHIGSGPDTLDRKEYDGKKQYNMGLKYSDEMRRALMRLYSSTST